ncbi:hypothetical protein SEUCBS140593_009396 [Sporothrix eucalyptigena]|uniref:Uncharacterized protein n=1 Tax=Sporothrix eucalyptigena TaxID=1812306 RepID=A0ABP0CUI3_9PEZI
MLQVVTARAAAPSLSERQSLENAQKYLAIAEAYHCISHTLLPSSYQDNRKLCVTSWKTNNRVSPHENELENQHDLASTQQFLDLLHVLVRIKQLCSTPFLQQEPPPWSLDSAFCAVQIELESILVRRVETIRMSAFNSHSHDESTMVEQTMKTERSTLCALLWHCCVIILNRTYLPIPERRTPGGDDHGGAAPEEVHCVDFPSAPYLFVQERIHRCESSASAVFGLCRDLVTTSGAFFQLDVLFRVHDINTPLRSASADPQAAFADYFARFVDLDEPSLVPLDSQEYVQGHATAAAAQRGATANKTHRSTTAQANSGADQEQPLWIQSYSGYLYEDMHSDDGTDVAVRDGKPKKFNEPNESEEPRLDAIICSPARDKPPALQDSSGYRVDEKSLHVPESILTSMPVNDMISYESRVRHHQGSMPRWDNAFFGSPGDMLSGAGFAPYGDVPSLYEFGEMMPDVLVELKANEDAWAEIMANMDGPLP